MLLAADTGFDDFVKDGKTCAKKVIALHRVIALTITLRGICEVCAVDMYSQGLSYSQGPEVNVCDLQQFTHELP